MLILHYRFSDANCKKCIVGLLERIGKAYKSDRKHSTFIMDLMELDIPNLLLVQSPKEDDPNVEQLFIEMIRTFIKNYALRETISNQVPTIMVINVANYQRATQLNFVWKTDPICTCNLGYF